VNWRGTGVNRAVNERNLYRERERGWGLRDLAGGGESERGSW
jgi:hypothetical protein